MVTNELKWTAVTRKDIENANYRLEANVFNIDARAAFTTLKECKYPSVKLKELLINCFYGGRAKRNYVKKEVSSTIGFLGSSEMLEINPKPTKFFSTKFKNIESFKVKEGTLLISRSGTIGNITVVNKTLSKFLISEHAIRMTSNGVNIGYIYTYFRTKLGQVITQSNIFGAVIQQIEPEHIIEIPIPNAPDDIKKSIHDKIMRSFALRDESNNLIDEAESLMMKALKLPDFDTLKPDLYKKNAGVQTFTVKLNMLNDRFEGSYHIPIISKIIDCLLDSGAKILPLGNKELTNNIIMAGRFKRNYVEEGEGVVFLGGKQIYELDPTGKKYLSLTQHEKRINSELFIKQNMIAVTCSGTIGKVNIIPKHWEKWTMSQHVLRVVPKNNFIAGYLYIWLNSDYGRVLIERETYGSVVDEIHDDHLANVPIPILRDKAKIKEINDLALRANDLRSEAYYLEQEAIKEMNESVILAKK